MTRDFSPAGHCACGKLAEALGVPAISFVGGLVMTFFGEQVLRLFR